MKLFLALVVVGLASSTLAAPAWEASLLRTLQVQKKADIIISFKNADVAKVRSNAVAKARGGSHTVVRQSMYDALTAHATSTQSKVLSMLEKQRSDKMEIISLWITNEVAVKGADMSIVNSLMTFDEIAEIREAKKGGLIDPVSITPLPENYVHAGEEWGVIDTGALEAWAAGYKGQGVTVGSIDTGCRATHEALRAAFRTDHGWFDPAEGHNTPTDGHGHGTHTIGTMVGRTKGVGVAPDANFIFCKGMNSFGSGYETDFKACGQFMVCPTESDGRTNPRCDLAPVAVGNSWGYIGNHGFFDEVIDTWIAAGIAPVFAAGNEGTSCSTLRAPGSAPRAITIGAIDDTNTMTYFSSAGPSPFGDIKPTVSAPGQNTVSSYSTSDTSYTSMSGTSMATPHTIGLIALLHSKRPGLTVAEVERALREGAQPTMPTGDTCGGIRDNVYPNNHVGHGKINAVATLNRV